jgi:beta-lactamase superfamily II metal-dependent hydrolase
VSTPANVVAVPLCVLVLVSNLLSLMLAGWFPAAAELFNHAGWFGMEGIRLSSEWFAKWPFAYAYVPAPGLFTTCLFYALLLGLLTGWLFRPALRYWKLASVCVITLLWSWFAWQQLATTKMTILPANGGTSIYCDSPGSRKDLLIDVGTSNSVQYIAKPFLRAQGVNQLPNLLLTHGDIHHIGGTEPLAQIFRLSRIYTNPLRFRSTPYRRILERLNRTPGLLKTVNRGDQLGNWTVLHPDSGDRFSKADDGTVVLQADYEGSRMLLLSDLGPEGQVSLLARYPDLRADIVVAGLPAAGEPLGNALIDAIRPRLIIISDSALPVSERAGPKLRTRLAHKQIPTIFTRDTGAVTVKFKQKDWTVETMSGLELSNTDSASRLWEVIKSALPDPG